MTKQTKTQRRYDRVDESIEYEPKRGLEYRIYAIEVQRQREKIGEGRERVNNSERNMVTSPVFSSLCSNNSETNSNVQEKHANRTHSSEIIR